MSLKEWHEVIMKGGSTMNTYFIKRIADKMWFSGKDGPYCTWSKDTAKKLTAAAAGSVLSELPGGMEEGVYKLIQLKE